MVLFRSRLFPMLDALVPKDVPFGSMESQPYSHPRMEDFGGLGRAKPFVPALDEDCNNLAMRFVVGLYQEDHVLDGGVANHVAGIAPYTEGSVAWSRTPAFCPKAKSGIRG